MSCHFPSIKKSASTRCLTLLQKLNLHDSGYKNDRLEQLYDTDIKMLRVQQPTYNLKTKSHHIWAKTTYGSFWLRHNEYKFKEISLPIRITTEQEQGARLPLWFRRCTKAASILISNFDFTLDYVSRPSFKQLKMVSALNQELDCP